MPQMPVGGGEQSPTHIASTHTHTHMHTYESIFTVAIIGSASSPPSLIFASYRVNCVMNGILLHFIVKLILRSCFDSKKGVATLLQVCGVGHDGR